MPDPTDWHLIDRYLAGEATPDEISALETRAKSDPAWATALDLLRADATASSSTNTSDMVAESAPNGTGRTITLGGVCHPERRRGIYYTRAGSPLVSAGALPTRANHPTRSRVYIFALVEQ